MRFEQRSTMLQRQVFSDGISVVVVDLDYSNTLMTNALFHSYDVALLVAPPATSALRNPSAEVDEGGIVVSCKTRRMEALRIPLVSIRDVRRRSASTTETGLPCVEVDFEASSSVFHSSFTAAPSTHHLMTRSLRLVCQMHRDQRQCDIVFGAILAAWRMTQGILATPTPSPSSSPRGGASNYGRWDHPSPSASRLAATVHSFMTAKTPSTDLSRWDRLTTERKGHESGLLHSRSRNSLSHEPVVVTPSTRDVEFFNLSDTETDRMLDTCAELETQLKLIQQRRMQRQQLLVSLDCRAVSGTDASPEDSGQSSSSSIRYFHHQKGNPSATAIQVYDPSAVASGFTAVCPHCGIYSGADHNESCPQRTVQCMRCLSRMKLREFPMHASLCVKQAAAANPNNLPLSPDAYLNGTHIPKGVAPPPPAAEQELQQSAQPSQLSKQSQAAPSNSSEANAVADGGNPKSKPLPLLERNISFSEIPRVQSIIAKKDDKESAESPRAYQQRTKSLRFVEDDNNVPQRTTGGGSTPRRRLTTFPDDEPSPAVTTIQCQWCKKYAPPDHPRKCAERRVLCTLCREEVFLRDKKEHRLVCTGEPTEYAAAQEESRSYGSFRGGGGGGRGGRDDLDDIGEDEEAYQRRIKKLESYRQRLDVLRRANAENGTPSHGFRGK